AEPGAAGDARRGSEWDRLRPAARTAPGHRQAVANALRDPRRPSGELRYSAGSARSTLVTHCGVLLIARCAAARGTSQPFTHSSATRTPTFRRYLCTVLQ